MCANGFQDGHSTPTRAFEKLQLHFREAHPTKILRFSQAPQQTRLNFAPPPTPFAPKSVWLNVGIPEEARDSLRVFIPKADPTAHPRGITMKSVIEKAIVNTIAVRLQAIPLPPAQYGLQRARDTLRPIKLLNQAVRSARRRGKHLYCVFIDFKDA